MKEPSDGKIDKAQLLIFPPALLISAILIYQAYRWMVPHALTIDKIEVVNVVQALDGITPLRKNGIMFHQSEPLADGGSGRLFIARASDQRTHVLVQGCIAHGFLGSKIPLDKMINLRVNTKEFTVEADREPVPFILLTPRTTPVQVEFGNMPESTTPLSLLGMAASEELGQDVANTGIDVELQPSAQGGGLMGGLGTVRFDVKFNPGATAWIELPRSPNLPSPVMGGVDLEVGFLIPLDSNVSGRPAIRLFGERVARLPRDLFAASSSAGAAPQQQQQTDCLTCEISTEAVDLRYCCAVECVDYFISQSIEHPFRERFLAKRAHCMLQTFVVAMICNSSGDVLIHTGHSHFAVAAWSS